MWNYRIVRYKDGSGFGLHEVFYDDEGLAYAMTAEAVRFVCDATEGPQGITQSLLTARVDARKRPIFDEPKRKKDWPGKSPSVGKSFRLAQAQ